ncbi:MAG: hypothetical protein IPP66_05485 [Anaerolineales bacterium]|nr:hypothetical protein [Anaerolineales bacterium]
MDVDPGFLVSLEKLLHASTETTQGDDHSKIVSFAANELAKRLLSVNPYLELNSSQIEKLEGIYRRTWQEMRRTGNIKITLMDIHYPELSKWLASLYPSKFQKILKTVPVVGSVVYEEYSAELQLELLGIDIYDIQQPVLDIGCGGQANLVRYLRSLGLEGYGVDRHLDVHGSYLTEVDWFAYRFERGAWGTIISNMSFTNHLNYAYLHDVSQLERYLLRMKDILSSLFIGGCFYYAPSLPFVEDKLSINEYRVERVQKVNNIFVSKVTKVA